jgi:hypothetical protein
LNKVNENNNLELSLDKINDNNENINNNKDENIVK